MKIKNLIGVALIAIATLLTPADNGTAAPSLNASLPVYSIDAMRNYALGQVVRGARRVHASSIDGTIKDSLTYTNVFGVGAEDVLTKLFAAEFKYRLSNPTDTLHGWIWLYDKNDNLLFYGSADYTAAQLKAGQKPAFNIWMQNIPMGQDVKSAEVLALDSNGIAARHYPIEVNNGQFNLPIFMAGATNGILVLKLNDGTLLTYDLSKGAAVTPETSSELGGSYKIEGHYVVVGNSNGTDTTVKVIENWNRPTVFLQVTATPKQTVAFDVTGIVRINDVTSFERPYSIEITPVMPDGTEGASNTYVMPSDQPGSFGFGSGKFRIRFLWKYLGNPGNIYTGPDGDGKG